MGWIFLMAIGFALLSLAISVIAASTKDSTGEIVGIAGSFVIFLSSFFALGYGYDYNYARGWNDHITLGGDQIDPNNITKVAEKKEKADVIRRYNQLQTIDKKETLNESK